MSKRYTGPIDPVTRAPVTRAFSIPLKAPKGGLAAGTVVRYIGVQDPKMAGIEGVVLGAHGAAASASNAQWLVKWVSAVNGRNRGLPGARWESVEPAWNLKPLRGFTKPFRDGLAWANTHETQENKS